jgi:hypothetical protein
MKLTETIERWTNKMLQKTIDLQKKQIKQHKEQVKRHEVLLKQLMLELGYPAWKIKAVILANYRNTNEDDTSTKK